jgi:hypothetical protein
MNGAANLAKKENLQMPGKLYIIANATDFDLDFANTESPFDALTVDDHTIAYTGGKDGDFCNIPTCESAEDFDDHHMSVTLTGGSSLNICFWKNNSQGNIVYYSTDGKFSYTQMPGGNTDYDQAALLVYPGEVNVQMSNVTDHN